MHCWKFLSSCTVENLCDQLRLNTFVTIQGWNVFLESWKNGHKFRGPIPLALISTAYFHLFSLIFLDTHTLRKNNQAEEITYLIRMESKDTFSFASQRLLNFLLFLPRNNVEVLVKRGGKSRTPIWFLFILELHMCIIKLS